MSSFGDLHIGCDWLKVSLRLCCDVTNCASLNVLYKIIFIQIKSVFKMDTWPKNQSEWAIREEFKHLNRAFRFKGSLNCYLRQWLLVQNGLTERLWLLCHRSLLHHVKDVPEGISFDIFWVLTCPLMGLDLLQTREGADGPALLEGHCRKNVLLVG